MLASQIIREEKGDPVNMRASKMDKLHVLLEKGNSKSLLNLSRLQRNLHSLVVTKEFGVL